jgi:hypothetical protein
MEAKPYRIFLLSIVNIGPLEEYIHVDNLTVCRLLKIEVLLRDLVRSQCND